VFAEPTINDFLDNIRWHLTKALNDAGQRIAIVRRDAAARGLINSGYAINCIFERGSHRNACGCPPTLRDRHGK
jgi:hypothetical protein